VPRHHSTALRVYELERRDAPAILVSPFQVTYQDVDGDNVSITFSKPILAASNVADVFGSGFVTGTKSQPQQLTQIDLAAIAAPSGTAITLTAVRSLANGGDGLAALGHINATGIDLGPVVIDGDLGRVKAGDATTATSGLKGLTVQSLGRYGTITGAPDLFTEIQGRLDFLTVKSDVREAQIEVLGGTNGRIGPVLVGGSLIGGPADFSGRIASSGDMGLVTVRGDLAGADGSGSGKVESSARLAGVIVGGSVRGGDGDDSGGIESERDMGPVTIRGDLIGGGPFAGSVDSEGALAAVVVGGSVIGGFGDSSGRIKSESDMGLVTIRGDLEGSDGFESGSVISEAGLAGVTIGGSVRGADGERSGAIFSIGDMGRVTIGGDLAGAFGESSGRLSSGGRLAGAAVGGSVRGGFGLGTGRIDAAGGMGSVTIRGDLIGSGDGTGTVLSERGLVGITVGGSVIGGFGDSSGVIIADGDAGQISIGGDLKGGSTFSPGALTGSGFIRARRIAGITLGGSLIAGTQSTAGTPINNGAIRVQNDIGAVLIKGSIVGNADHPAVISARGQAVPTATADVAIGSLRVLGRVEFGLILAGVDRFGIPRNADAQVGAVSVGGDWVASSLAAGVLSTNGNFGDGDDARMSGPDVKDRAGLLSRIASLTIGGQALGNIAGGHHFGVVAEVVAAMAVGDTPLPLNPGPGNDNFFVGISGDFTVNEV
jgi:hypothetical protein